MAGSITRLPSPTIPNPDFMTDPGVRGAVEEVLWAYPFQGRIPDVWAALPDEFGYAIPEQGAWIIVKEDPHTEIRVPLYSMWYARPFYRHRKLKINRRWVQWPFLRAVLTTDVGELHLLPGEYETVKDIRVWLDLVGKGVVVNWLGEGEPGDYADKLFYMRARGIDRTDAMLSLLPGLEEQNFIYLTLDFAAADAC